MNISTRSASNIEKSTSQVDKELRGVIGQPNKTAYTEDQIQACSIEAMRNGGTCEACQ
jgi:ribonucleoside-diphosphate reductase alpha chain